MPKFFDWITDLSHEKKRLIDHEVDAEKQINQFLINRAFSQGVDTVMYANEMNKAIGIPNRMFYDYYFHALRPKRRFNKWAKKTKDKYLDDVIEYFGYSYTKAIDVLKILTEDQLKEIRGLLNKGGKK